MHTATKTTEDGWTQGANPAVEVRLDTDGEPMATRPAQIGQSEPQMHLFDAGGAKPDSAKVTLKKAEIDLDADVRLTKGSKIRFTGTAIVRGAHHDDKEDTAGTITGSALTHIAVVTDLKLSDQAG